AIQGGSGYAATVQLMHTLEGAIAQLVDRAELDRLSRTRLGASRDEAIPLPVVAERTLVRVAVEGAAGDDAEGAGRDAVGAAVADVGLDVDVVELVCGGGRRSDTPAGKGP